MIHVFLLTGRVYLWQECIDAIERFAMQPRIKPGDECWVFVSAHGDPNFADADPCNVRELIARTKPVASHVEKYVLDPPEPHPMYRHKSDSVNSCLRYSSMWFHNWKAFDMLEKAMQERNVSKDEIGWVVKLRCDYNPIEPLVLPDTPEQKMIYVPNSGYHYAVTPRSWLPDQVNAGDFDTMKAYCSVYVNREKFFNEHKIQLYIPEEVLKCHMDIHGIRWCKTRVRCEYTISGRRFEVDEYAGNKNVEAARFGGGA
jgi:hypothetical protein